MARSDAVGKEPTIEEINSGEASRFQGFSTQDGVVAKGEQTAEEAAAHAQQAALKGGTKVAGAASPKLAAQTVEDDDEEGDDDAAAAGAEETPEAKAAREAAEAKLTPAQKAAKALQAKVGGKDIKHRSASDRIGQAVARQRATERELATEREERARERGAFEARLAALETRPLTADGKAAITIDKDAPRATDYQYGELDSAYIRDLARYETRKEFAAQTATQTAASQTAEQRREAQALTEAKNKFEVAGREKFDDFDEVVVEGAQNNSWPLTKTFAELMFDSDLGTDIAYYLATHVEEAKKIMVQTPATQARAFGRLEATFSSSSADATQQENGAQAEQAGQAAQQQTKTPVQARTTQAPPPPNHRTRGAGGKTQVSADTNDFSAFERMAMG